MPTRPVRDRGLHTLASRCRRLVLSSSIFLCAMLAACSSGGGSGSESGEVVSPGSLAGPRIEAATVLVVGDSLSSGYGLDGASSWVDLMEEELSDYVNELQVVNASVGGETAGGASRRLPMIIEASEPDLLVLQVGLNDAFRRAPPADLRTDLETMSVLASESGAQVLMIAEGMPLNYGPAYSEMVAAAFRDAAANTGATLIPRFLERIADDRSWFQEDGLHPTAAAQPLLLETVLPTIIELLGIDVSAMFAAIPVPARVDRRP